MAERSYRVRGTWRRRDHHDRQARRAHGDLLVSGSHGGFCGPVAYFGNNIGRPSECSPGVGLARKKLLHSCRAGFGRSGMSGVPSLTNTARFRGAWVVGRVRNSIFTIEIRSHSRRSEATPNPLDEKIEEIAEAGGRHVVLDNPADCTCVQISGGIVTGITVEHDTSTKMRKWRWTIAATMMVLAVVLLRDACAASANSPIPVITIHARRYQLEHFGNHAEAGRDSSADLHCG